MSRLNLPVRLLLLSLLATAVMLLPTSPSTAQCNGVCGKAKGKPACIRSFNSTGDPVDLGTDCIFQNEQCVATQCM